MKELSTAELAEIVAAWAGTDPSARRERGRRGYQWAIGATSDQWRRFNALLLEQTPQARVAADLLLSVLFSAAEATLWTDESAREIYLTSDAGAALRRTMLFQWASRADEACLSEFCQLIVAAPPASSDDGAAVIAPLLQSRDSRVVQLFPALLDGLRHVSIAAPILDLANFLYREQLVATHPAAGREKEFAQLLTGITQRLSRLEERPEEVDRELGAVVRDSSALAVALCHTLSLLGAKEQVGCLYQALELSHRRIRVEAAAALAKLGESSGEDVLVQMAAEPVVRLFAIAFAEELDLLDRIPDEHRDDGARAEAELSLWLAQPAQFGFPPSRVEQLDHRTLYWPGYDEPVDCFLIRFGYQFDQDEFAAIGLAGPTTYAFAADLSDLPFDDLYAAFAGRDAEHEEIYEVRYESADEGQRREAMKLVAKLRSSGYEDVAPRIWGFFFGERTLTVTATKAGLSAVAVADSGEIFSRQPGAGNRPLGPEEVYCVYKGRKLLRSFNES